MKINRIENAKNGIIQGLINQISAIVFPFIIQTVTIRQLGAEYVGIKGLFGSILTVFSLAELGIGSAIVFCMYKPIADDDIDTICSLLFLYKKIYRVIGAAILLMGIVITPFLNLLIKGDCPENLNIYAVFILFLVGTVIPYLFYGYKVSLLSAYQRQDIISKTNTYVNLLMCGIQIVILTYSGNYYLYLITAIVFAFINNVVVSIVVDYMYPEIKCRGKVEHNLLIDIRKKVGGLFIGKVCGVTRNTLDTVFISALIGLTQTAIYSNYYYIINMLICVVAVFLVAVQAGIGNSVAVDDKQKNYKDMQLMNFAYMLVCGWITVCMICLYQPFMRIWVGEKLMFDNDTMLLFPLYFYILKMGDIITLYIDANGLYWETRFRAIFEMLANVVLNYILIKRLGVKGAVLSTIFTILFFSFIWGGEIVFKHYFHTGKGKYYLTHLLYGGVTIGIAVISSFLCHIVQVENNWGDFGLKILICIIVPGGLYYLAYRKNRLFKETIKLFRATFWKAK